MTGIHLFWTGILEESAIMEFFAFALITNEGVLPAEASQLSDYLVEFIGEPIHGILR